jgi:hypothetical protein
MDEEDLPDYDGIYLQLRTWEASKNLIKKYNFSAFDVLEHYKPQNEIKIFRSLNNTDVTIWLVGFLGFFKVFRKLMVTTLGYSEVRVFFDLCTALNIFVLCLQGFMDPEIIVTANNVFSFCLLVEIVMKVIS